MRGPSGCSFLPPFGGFEYACHVAHTRSPWPHHHRTGCGGPRPHRGHHHESPDHHRPGCGPRGGPHHGPFGRDRSPHHHGQEESPERHCVPRFGPHRGPRGGHHGPPECDRSPHHRGNDLSADRRRSWRGPDFEARGGPHHGPPGCDRAPHHHGPPGCDRSPHHHGNELSPDHRRSWRGPRSGHHHGPPGCDMSHCNCDFWSRRPHGPPCGNPDETNGPGTDSEGPESRRGTWYRRCHRRRGCGSPERRGRSCHRGRRPGRCQNEPCCAGDTDEVVVIDEEENDRPKMHDKAQNTDQTVLVQRIVVERNPRPSSV